MRNSVVVLPSPFARLWQSLPSRRLTARIRRSRDRRRRCSLPTIQKQKLSNGLPVWIVELHEVPVAQVNLVVLSGTANDPPGKYGVASLAAAMLEEGAGSRSALEIADAVDYLGADLGAATTSDLSAVRLHVPVARLADALPIMADVALRPTFPKDELDRQRQQRLTSLLQGRDDPPTISSVAFSRILYGKGHRYGTPQMGTAETIKTLTADDLRGVLHERVPPGERRAARGRRHHRRQGDAAVREELRRVEGVGRRGGRKAAADRRTAGAADLSDRQAGRGAVADPHRPHRRAAIDAGLLPDSGAEHDPRRIVHLAPEQQPARGARLHLRRQLRRSTCAARAGPFSAAAGVQTDKTSEALKEFFNELNAILKPVPAEELARAKNYVALRYPSAFETTGDISRRLEDALVYKLPDDYFAKYVQNIQAVTAADVQRVAQKYIKPDHLAVVVVGDLKAIEPGIRALNLGPIKVMTIDEVFGPKP